MREHLHYIAFRWLSGFWLRPGLMVLGSIVLATVTIELEQIPVVTLITHFFGLDQATPGGTREVLSTIASATMSVTSLVFSMTLVAITLASQQLGPRLIGNFMEDRVTQTALGVFLGSFVYSLIVMLAVREGDPEVVPTASLGVAFVLALLSCGYLVFFLHHIATSIQADSVVSRIGAALEQALDRVFDGSDGTEEPVARLELGSTPVRVETETSGYVQAVDFEALVACAQERDLVMSLVVYTGAFVIAPSALVEIAPPGEVDDDVVRRVRRAIVLGDTRTTSQDAEFALASLTEMAQRALSSGINDPRTAMGCVDRIGAALAIAMAHAPQRRLRRDAEGRVRLVLGRPLTFAALIQAGFDPIRHDGGDRQDVALHMIGMLRQLAGTPGAARHLQALRKHRLMLARSLTPSDPFDADALRRELGRLDAALDRLTEERRSLPASDTSRTAA